MANGFMTGEALIEYLDSPYAASSMPPSQRRAVVSAVNAVLSVFAHPAAVDFSKQPVDSLVQEFRRRRSDLSEETKDLYERRFRQAQREYGDYLKSVIMADPRERELLGVPKMNAAERSNLERAVNYFDAVVARSNMERHMDSQMRLASEREPSGSRRLMAYEIPLRPGMRVQLSLPEDLSVSDAERISRFVMSLAFEDDETTPTSGRRGGGPRA